MKKEFIAFISYAREDKDLADDIRILIENSLDQLGYIDKVFKDDKSLNNSQDWKSQIVTGIQKSKCIIPIFTINSINHPWISFELGVAEVSECYKYPIITAGITASSITCPESNANYLVSRASIFNLIKNIIQLNHETIDEVKLEEFIFDNNPIVKRIIKKSLERWVYIIGSKPLFEDTKEEKDWEEKTDIFLTSLTQNLLKKNYSIASFPTVDFVGKVVIRETAIANKVKNYSIAGLYEIDKTLRKISDDHKNIDKRIWNEILLNFRRTYLRDKEFVVIIGGQDGTREEFIAAKNLGKKFISIPCLSGFGEELWMKADEINEVYLNHELCINYKHCNGNCDKINEIVDLLK